MHGFKDVEYLDLLRNEIEAFRILFAEWIKLLIVRIILLIDGDYLILQGLIIMTLTQMMLPLLILMILNNFKSL